MPSQTKIFNPGKFERAFEIEPPGVCTETGTEIQYMISDEILREDLQYKVMSIVKEYLEADEK